MLLIVVLTGTSPPLSGPTLIGFTLGQSVSVEVHVTAIKPGPESSPWSEPSTWFMSTMEQICGWLAQPGAQAPTPAEVPFTAMIVMLPEAAENPLVATASMPEVEL